MRALGIESVQVVDPYDLEATEAALRRALDTAGPAVVISRRPCALLPEVRRGYRPLMVVADRCIGCGACWRLGCPAISKSAEVVAKTGRPKAQIDPLLCTGCGICAQNCPQGAIVSREAPEAEIEEKG